MVLCLVSGVNSVDILSLVSQPYIQPQAVIDITRRARSCLDHFNKPKSRDRHSWRVMECKK